MPIDKKYQVFISSTFSDLQEERREVIRALLELDCIPAGMELFPASNYDAWTLIKRVIDDSDYYIVISAGRYGSVHPDTGVSYTEMEYDYAVATGKPVLAFLHEDIEVLQQKKVDVDPDKRQKLGLFRTKMKTKLVRDWGSAETLAGFVSRSLVQQIKIRPGNGWVRVNRALYEELERLSPNDKDFDLPTEMRKVLSDDLNVGRSLSSSSKAKDRVGNVYWLGHDLFWTYSAISRKADKGRIIHGLAQIRHHLASVEIRDTEFLSQIDDLYKRVVNMKLIDSEEYDDLAFDLNRILYRIGGAIEAHQNDFKSFPEPGE